MSDQIGTRSRQPQGMNPNIASSTSSHMYRSRSGVTRQTSHPSTNYHASQSSLQSQTQFYLRPRGHVRVTTQDSLVTGNIEPHRFAPEYKGSEGFDDGDGRITPTSRSRQSGIPLEPRGIQRTTNAIGEGIVDVELEEVKEEDPCPHCRPAIQFTCRDCLRKQKIQENEDELKVSITRLSAPENAGDERSTRVPDDERERERVEGPGHSRDTSSNHRRTPDHLKPRQAGKGLASGRLGKTGKGSIRNPMLGSGKYNEKMFSSKMFLRVYYADEKKKHELYKANFNDPEQ
eukprot:1144011-Amorphochlora_amoeboformis.AAC.1